MPDNSVIRKGEFQLHDLAFVPPQGAKILKTGGEGAELVLQSVDGYFITFNSSKTSLKTSLSELADGLEAVFLKEGGKWNRKLAYRKFPLASSEALDVLYQGPHTKDRVVYWQTPKRDFAVMFFAPTSKFDELTHKFDAMLDSFEVINKGKSTLSVKKTEKKEIPSGTSMAQKEETVESRKAQEQEIKTKLVVDSRLSFRVQLPEEWERGSMSANMVRWGGKKGAEDFQATFDLQNVRMAGLGRSNHSKAMDFVMGQLKDQIGRYAEKVSFEIHPGGEESQARHVVVRLNLQNLWYRQILSVFGRKKDNVFHIAAFTAPEDLFNRLWPKGPPLGTFQPIE